MLHIGVGEIQKVLERTYLAMTTKWKGKVPIEIGKDKMRR